MSSINIFYQIHIMACNELVQCSAPGPHLWQICSYISTAVVSGDCVLIEHSRSGVMGHQVISTRFKSQQAETNFTCNAFVSTLYESNNP